MGFGIKWRFWIWGCLSSSRTSVLVNGSLTEEFQISKGVRLGDPLYLFLFILATERLNVAVKSACKNSLVCGIKLQKWWAFHFTFILCWRCDFCRWMECKQYQKPIPYSEMFSYCFWTRSELSEIEIVRSWYSILIYIIWLLFLDVVKETPLHISLCASRS